MIFEKEEKKFGKSRAWTRVDRVKRFRGVLFITCATGEICNIDSSIYAVVSIILMYILIDSYLVQSAVSHLFLNQWRCLKLYLLFRFVWIVVVFSDLL